jgi:hypothetical protein
VSWSWLKNGLKWHLVLLYFGSNIFFRYRLYEYLCMACTMRDCYIRVNSCFVCFVSRESHLILRFVIHIIDNATNCYDDASVSLSHLCSCCPQSWPPRRNWLLGNARDIDSSTRFAAAKKLSLQMLLWNFIRRRRGRVLQARTLHVTCAVSVL